MAYDIAATFIAVFVASWGTQHWATLSGAAGACPAILVLALVNVVVFWFFHMYSSLWRYASISEAGRIVAAVTVGSVIGDVIFNVLFGKGMSLREDVMAWAVVLIICGGGRFAIRAIYGSQLWRFKSNSDAHLPRTLIVVHATTEYKDVNKNILLDVHRRLAATILGQKVCKKEIDLSLYRISKMGKEKPAVLLFYGPSGVGKTETAKQLSEALGGGLTRIQFSMFQNQEAFDYLFGGEHSKGSFARDLLARESNVVLLDEFDKVNPGLYNAFYELFDEGVLVDSYYRVEMGSAVFILTSNFGSEEEIKKALGPAMFSRIGACIKFEQLAPEELKKLINRHFDYLLQHLDDEEVSRIEQCGVRDWFLANASKFDNVRTLNQKIERAIFGVLTNKLLKEGSVD